MLSRSKILTITILVIPFTLIAYLFFGCSSLGCQWYNAGEYTQAYNSFRSIQNPHAIFNAGNAKFRIAERFELSGNHAFAQEAYEEALRLYLEVQRNDAGTDLIHNIAMVRQRLDQLKPSQDTQHSQADSVSRNGSEKTTEENAPISSETGTEKQEIRAPEKFFIEHGKVRQLSQEEVAEEFKNIEAFHEQMLQYLNTPLR